MKLFGECKTVHSQLVTSKQIIVDKKVPAKLAWGPLTMAFRLVDFHPF